MKKFIFILIAIFAFSACSDDDSASVDPVDPADPVSETINVTGMLTGDNTWTSRNQGTEISIGYSLKF